MEKIINEISTNMPEAVLCHILTTEGVAAFNYDEGKARCPRGVYWSIDDLMGLLLHHIRGLSKEQVYSIFPNTTYYVVKASSIMHEGHKVDPFDKCYVYQSEDIDGDGDVEDFLAHSVNDKVKELFEFHDDSDDYTYHLDIIEYTSSALYDN